MKTVVFNRDVLSRDREAIHLKFAVDGVPIKLTCNVLIADDFPKDDIEQFSHPAPCFTRIFCFNRGVAQLKTVQGTQELVPGTIYLLPSGMPFDVTYSNTNLYYFHLHITDFTGLSIFDNTAEVMALDDAYLFDSILQAYQDGSPQILLSALSLALSRLIAPHQKALLSRSTDMAGQRELLEYISHLPPAQININELAEEFGVSRSTLSRNFTQSVGCSLKEYINTLTVQKACERLRYSNDSIRTIAEELGFNHATYFYRFFKKHAGTTPLKYREE